MTRCDHDDVRAAVGHLWPRCIACGTYVVEVVVLNQANVARGGLKGWWSQFTTGDGQIYSSNHDDPWSCVSRSFREWHRRHVLGAGPNMAESSRVVESASPKTTTVEEGPRTRQKQEGHNAQQKKSPAERRAAAKKRG